MAVAASALAGLAAGVLIGLPRDREDSDGDAATSIATETGMRQEPESEGSEGWSPPANLIELTASPRQQLAFAESLESMDSDGCADLFGLYSKQVLIRGTAAQRAFREIFERWTAVDPARATEQMLALPLTTGVGGRRMIDMAIQGWAATAAHAGLITDHCGIYQGNAAAAGGDPGLAEGVIACTY